MNHPPFRLSKLALADLETIWEYSFKNWTKAQADRYYNLILDEIKFAAANPASGKSFYHIRKAYFAVKVKSHLIFYRKPEAAPIEIIRILHQRMDLKTKL